MRAKGVPAGDVLTCFSILLSGNNFHKISLLFSFMNLGMPSEPFFHEVQHSYCCPVIESCWEETKKATHDDLEGKDVILAGMCPYIHNKVYL